MELHCTSDFRELQKVSEKWVIGNKKGIRMNFPVYWCPLCGRNYTKLYPYPDSVKITLDGIEYTNILPGADEARYNKFLRRERIISKGTGCYVYDEGKFPECCCRCGQRSFLKSGAAIRFAKKGIQIPLIICKNCKCYYIRVIDYKKRPSFWKPYNIDILSKGPERLKHANAKSSIVDFEKEWIENTGLLQRKNAVRQQSEQPEKEAAQQVRDISDIKKEWIENTGLLQRSGGIANPIREYEAQKPLKTGPQNKLQETDRIKRQQEKIEEMKKRYSSGQRQQLADTEDRKSQRHDNTNIEAKDFVVRRSAFKCRYQEHSLQNIEGLIQIIDRNGNVSQVKVPAGYCANCNTFFIMESVYQSLKLKGIPVCRVSDEKAYLSGNVFANGMQLAQESVLMQYGYSVSQEEGLTSAARRKILALIVDHKILTRNEIIGYLDFFINQRKNQPRFEKAIDKWEQDREFISEYRAGEYIQYGVNGLYRKY